MRDTVRTQVIGTRTTNSMNAVSEEKSKQLMLMVLVNAELQWVPLNVLQKFCEVLRNSE